MTKNGFSRTFRYPSDDLRDKVRAAVKGRGFRSEQAFLIAACQNELERGDNAGAMDDLEARIVATLLSMGREVRLSSRWYTRRWRSRIASCSTF